MIDLPSPLASLGGELALRIRAVDTVDAAFSLLWDTRLYGLLNASAFEGLSLAAQAALDAQISELRMRAALRQTVRANDLQPVVQALHRAEVYPVVLKGAAIAGRLYPDPASRPSIDIDMLIPPRAVPMVHRVLKDHGWVLGAGVRGQWTSSQFSYRTDRSASLATSIDFHWRLTNRPQLHHALSYEEIFARSLAPASTFPFAHCVSSMDALIHAIVHLVGHHHTGVVPAIWYVDIAGLERLLSSSERCAVVTMLRERGLLDAAAVVWKRCAEGIGFEPSRDTEFLLRRQESANAWRVVPTSRGQEILADLHALSPLQRAFYLRELLFPPEENLRAAYGLSGQTSPLWRLYLRRFLRRGVRSPRV